MSYTDKSGFESKSEFVLAGAITKGIYGQIKARIGERSLIIPHRVGLPASFESLFDLEDFPDEEMDHPYCCLLDWKEGTHHIEMLTREPALNGLSLEKFVRRLENLEVWDTKSAMREVERAARHYRLTGNILYSELMSIKQA